MVTSALLLVLYKRVGRVSKNFINWSSNSKVNENHWHSTKREGFLREYVDEFLDGSGGSASGIYWAENRDAAKHPTMHRTVP